MARATGFSQTATTAQTLGPCYNSSQPPIRFSLSMPMIHFGDFEFDDQAFQLRRAGALLRLQQQPARVLAFLLGHRGSLVTREQIRLAIWGDDTFVDFEQGLNFCIRQIRIALNDQAEKPLYIETLPRLGYRFVARIEKPGEPVATSPEKRIRIGVIPIEDLSGQPEDYFAQGLTEDMISALSRIDPHRLRVTAGPKLARGEDESAQIDQLQRQLGLDYLLRGNVRRSADKIRVGVRLHDLNDKSVVWSETYDFKLADLLAIQEDVTQRISNSLALELLPSSTVGARRYVGSPAAYDAYLRGRYFWHKMTPDGIRLSMTYFQEALVIDSKFAPAYAGLADCYAQMGSIRVGTMKPLEALGQARSYLQKALDLDETLADAHCTLALIKSWYEYDWDGAKKEFQAALALEPGLVTALLWQSLYFSAVGKNVDAVASVQKAREIEPLSASVNLYLGVAQHHAGQYDLALRQMQQSIEIDPNYYRSHMFMGRNLCWLNRFDEAIVEHQRALELAPESFEVIAMLAVAHASSGQRQRALTLLKRVRAAEEWSDPSVLVAMVYAALGEVDEMFKAIKRAVAQKSVPIYVIPISEEFRPYHSDPRYKEFLASVGLQSLDRA
jgi:TolB-like protein/Tfp pilus assembly protein PilF